MIITLCGSTRFPEAFDLANMHLTMLGHVVISVGVMGHADRPRGGQFLTGDGADGLPVKTALDQLHLRKIEIADAIYVVNPGGYVGKSTQNEIKHAAQLGKKIFYMFPAHADLLQ